MRFLKKGTASINPCFVYTLFFTLILLALSMQGCATVHRLMQDDTFLMQAATEDATARVLMRHPEWKSTWVSITDSAIALINTKEIISVTALSGYIKSRVNWDHLIPEDQSLLSAFMDELAKELQKEMTAKNITLPEQQLIEAQTFIGWSNAAAKRQKS